MQQWKSIKINIEKINDWVEGTLWLEHDGLLGMVKELVEGAGLQWKGPSEVQQKEFNPPMQRKATEDTVHASPLPLPENTTQKDRLEYAFSDFSDSESSYDPVGGGLES